MRCHCFFSWALLTAFLFLFASCSEIGSSPSTEKKTETIEPQDKATSLFAEKNIPLFELSLSDSAWVWLQANATKEEYVPAKLLVNHQVVGTVGLRYKGSYGNLFNCFKNGERLPECKRLSFKIKFDKYDQELRYAGLKRINLHSLRADPSLLRDRLAYRLYREMGIHAPRASHAMVSINGLPAGLYGMIEAPDGRFTKSRWRPGGDGNLYKEIWPVSHSPSTYRKALKTNEESGIVDGMIAFANDLPKIASEGDRQLFENYTDPIRALHYLVVDLAINNIDGYRTFYCGPNPRSVKECGPHNFYWYEQEEGNHFTLIPWDLDAAFPTYTWLPEMPEWNDLTYDCSQPERRDITVLWAPICDPYFRTLALYYENEYHQAIQKLLTTVFATGQPEALLQQWSQQLLPYVEADTLYQPAHWQNEIEKLKEMVALGRWEMEQRLNRRSPQRLGLRADTINSFEEMVSALAVTFANAYSNSNSQLQTTLEQEEPLSGAASWKIGWIYRDEPGVAWGQWGSWSAFWQGGGERDLRGTELRLKIAVRPFDRPFNIDVLSARNADANVGKNWGWEFPASYFANEVVLSLDSHSMRYAWAGQDPDADGQPPLDTLLRYATGLAFYPAQVGRKGDGFYPEGGGDSGWALIDDLEFLYK